MKEEITATAPRLATGGGSAVAARLNWLRAGVLGANDGIVSMAGIVIGVAAATADRGTIMTAGTAGLVAGAVSMALGEYVSVSTQRDSERVLLDGDRTTRPALDLAERAALYERRGLSPATARRVAEELTERDAFGAHAEAELTNPAHAALSSAVSFTIGALLPLLAILAPAAVRIPLTVIAAAAALASTGAAGA
ncbi:MAG: VIT1/CCC1 transporter family protein, partial [Nocardia sp.]|nr:VIT1/CCC1 transporter family protein [Nocardia sp.]